MRSVTSSFFWKAFEQYGVMLIQLFLQIILARIVAPSDFGAIAILNVFILISSVFVYGGLPVALVRAPNVTTRDASSVFYFSATMAALFYAGWFLLSPFIASFFSVDNLPSLLRIMLLSIFPNVYSSVQIALLRRDMNFRPQAFANIFAISLSGVIALIAAYQGAGVWALLLQHLLYSFTLPIFIFFYYRWVPSPYFSTQVLKKFISFGWKVFAFELTDVFFVQIRTLLIGGKYSSSDLAYYERGKQFPFLILKGINGSLQSVLLPKMSSVQDEKERVFFLLRKSISISTFCLYPLLIYLYIAAPALIEFLLTEKWLPAVPYLRMFVISFSFWPVTTAIIQALYALGESGKVFISQLVRRIFDLLVLLFTYNFGVQAIALGEVAVGVIALPIFMLFSFSCLKYSFSQQLRDLILPIVCSLPFFLIDFALHFIPIPHFVYLLILLALGGVIYIALARLFRMETLFITFEILRKLLKR